MAWAVYCCYKSYINQSYQHFTKFGTLPIAFNLCLTAGRRFYQKYGYSGCRDNPPSLCELWRDRRGCEVTDFIRREALLRNVKRLPVGKREALASRVRI